MTNKEYLERLRIAREELRADPEKLKKFMQNLGLFKKRRTIVGEERDRVMTMLRLLGPGEQSNNQHVWTESWRIDNTEYNYHVGTEFDDLEEVIDDE